MRRIAHLSDIHFGRERPDLVDHLVDALEQLTPDLVVISGDLTQRARNRQFQAARSMIDRLSAPVLVVPGNHDVPLDNLYARLVHPWRRYRRWISSDLEPVFNSTDMVVVGLNSVNPLNWQRGKFGWGASKVRKALDGAENKLKLVTLHHPLAHPPGTDKSLIRGADGAIRALADLGVDAVLTGHLHLWSADLFPGDDLSRGMIQLRAGTGLSSRQRGEENDFNLLTCEPDKFLVERYATRDAGLHFDVERSALFRRDPDGAGWVRVEGAPPVAAPEPPEEI